MSGCCGNPSNSKIKNTMFFISFVVIISLGFYTGCTNKSHEGHESKTSESKKLTYVCPMHPQITSDKAGQTCSICGMNLVLLEDEEKHEDHESHQKATDQDVGMDETEKNSTPKDHSDFTLSLNKQQLIGVKLGRVEIKNLFKTISAPGRIAFDPELYTAQSEYLEALRQKQRVKDSSLSDVKRSTDEMINAAKIRLQVLGLSSDQIKNLATKGSQSEGLLVAGKGQDSWVYADVYEVDLPHIKKDLAVQISANFLQGKILPGKVISVDQVINPDTRTAKVRIQLLKSDISIRPESYVNVSILVPLGEHLSVPIEALLDTGKDTFVFVKKGEGNFEPRRIGILFETGDSVAVASGLNEKEEIAVSANFLLDSESRLKAVIKGSSSSGGHKH